MLPTMSRPEIVVEVRVPMLAVVSPLSSTLRTSLASSLPLMVSKAAMPSTVPPELLFGVPTAPVALLPTLIVSE